MRTNEVVQIIDDHLISTGKHFIGLRAAISLLKLKSTEDIDLKAMLERGEIPHAYQTDVKPRQWRIPHSNQATYHERRSEFLKTNSPNSIFNTADNPPALNYRRLLTILGVGYLIYLLISTLYSDDNSTSGNRTFYVNSESFATHSREDFERMYDCVINGDEEGLRKMLSSGRIVVLQKGTAVYLVDANVGYNIVRKRGSMEELWIAGERISRN